jgi:hypothetical protein
VSGFINTLATLAYNYRRTLDDDVRSEIDSWLTYGQYTSDTSPWEDAMLWSAPRNISGGSAGLYYVGNDASIGNRFAPPPQESGGQQMRKFIGITRDSAGNTLGNAVVHVYLTNNDQFLRLLNSDSGGYFEACSEYQGVNHYLVAYKAGSPDIAGTTVNTLQPA